MIRNIDLNKDHLIEASAGTGKTYSIGLLALRLLLERGLGIEQVLLVTFTEAAAGELRDRIRAFITKGIEALSGQPLEPGDQPITDIVRLPSHRFKTDTEKAEALERALLDLEKANITTIHGFCQRTLHEFAFEAGQPFGRTLKEDLTDILETVVDRYLRHHVNHLPARHLAEAGLTREHFMDCLYISLSGLEFAHTQTEDALDHEALKDPEANLGKLEIRQALVRHAMAIMVPEVKAELERRNLITFDDLIGNLYARRNDTAMQQVLRDRYLAVFVDEFQDTDARQYGIFHDIFQVHPGTTVFYIGDPKQSIYAWRQADLNTYFAAKEAMLEKGKVLPLTDNFRSNERYVDAMNRFFQPEGGFNLFHPNGQGHLTYHHVVAGGKGKDATGLRYKDDTPMQPLIVETAGDIEGGVVDRVLRLMQGGCTLNGKRVSFSDIAIIVRKNKEARKVRDRLMEANIPTALVDNSDIFQSSEAKDLLSLLRAILQRGSSTMREVLVSPTFGTSIDELVRVDFNRMSRELQQLEKTWEEDGIHAALQAAFRFFDVRGKWKDQAVRGERVLTNLSHLADLLQEQAIAGDLTPTALLALLEQRTSKESASEEAGGNLRLEALPDAVRIVTIHKSKGLEFPIVILPYLDLKSKINHFYNTFTFHRDGRFHYDLYTKVVEQTPAIGEMVRLHEQENKEENARLMYVAITRAQFGCFIFLKDPRPRVQDAGDLWVFHDKHESFSQFREDPLAKASTNYGETREYRESHSTPVYPDRDFPALDLKARRSDTISYSGIARHGDAVAHPRNNSYAEDSYDHFAFKYLSAGKQTGTLLHAVLEYVDFDREEDWSVQIDRAIHRFASGKKDDTMLKEGILRMLPQVLGAQIRLGEAEVPLREVLRTRRIHEMPFHFPVPPYLYTGELAGIVNDDRRITVNHFEAQGLMHGVIDLFFEHDGRYYILDWKSNYLGDRLEDYGPEQLADAMNASNYHLQYLLYATAADRYLRSRLPGYDFERHFGGVIYLFLRGNREGQAHGVYTQRVTRAEIDAIEGVLAGAPVA